MPFTPYLMRSLFPGWSEWGGTEAGVLRDHGLREITLRIVRADFKMLDGASLLAVNPLSCPILAFGGDHDAFADQEGVEGWRFHTNAKFRCHFFHGGHFFIWENMEKMAKDITVEMGCVCRRKKHFFPDLNIKTDVVVRAKRFF